MEYGQFGLCFSHYQEFSGVILIGFQGVSTTLSIYIAPQIPSYLSQLSLPASLLPSPDPSCSIPMHLQNQFYFPFLVRSTFPCQSLLFYFSLSESVENTMTFNKQIVSVVCLIYQLNCINVSKNKRHYNMCYLKFSTQVDVGMYCNDSRTYGDICVTMTSFH